MTQRHVNDGSFEHPLDITPRKIGELGEFLPIKAPKVQQNPQLPVFATGAIAVTELPRGILVLCAQMRGVRPITADTQALSGIQIEARLTGRSLAHETMPPHRSARIESGLLSVNGFPTESHWKVEMPAQAAFETISIAYPVPFLEGLAKLDPSLAEAALKMVAEHGCQREEMTIAQRLLFVKLYQLCLKEGGNKLRAEAIALELLADAIEAQGRDTAADSARHEGQAQTRLVEHAGKSIDAMLSAPPSIAELARLLRVSETRLKRAFSETTGESVGAYIARRRLETAWDLVMLELPLAKVADEVGYASPEAFSKAFRRYFGESPSAARAAGRQKPHPPIDDCRVKDGLTGLDRPMN